jgi:hypothetical protein
MSDTHGYKITHDLAKTIHDPMSAKTQNEFSRQIHEVFAQRRPMRIVETGTYYGAGTTAIIGSAIRQNALNTCEFFSIEVNPQHYNIALQNVRNQGINVRLLLGLSVPRSLLMTQNQIEQEYVKKEIDGVFVDYYNPDRAAAYYHETNFGNVPDDLLGKVLEHFKFHPDFVLLDSAGHLGHVEFVYTIAKLKGPCVIALDDTQHIKHYQSVLDMKGDPRFKIIAESNEKFGSCIAEFTP